ncbi:hypothetical protein AGMMS49525_02610 [Bacteroidia bacterium]|nr:hypothetical protein AGMMS49525_02610 [Bacteroidia bacterium]
MTELDDITQCVYNIVATAKGSDALRPDFGSDVHLYIDQPMNEVQPMLILAVTEAVQKWEKRIEARKCRLVPESLDKRTLVLEAVVLATGEQTTIKTTI